MDMRPINDKIIEIWRQYQNDYPEATKLSPMQFHDLPDHVDILFLGINPSFNDTMEPMREIFTFNNFNEENRSRMIEYDSSTVDWVNNTSNQPYFREILKLFKPGEGFRNLERASKVNLDLLFIRETNQAGIDNFIYNDGRKSNGLNQFALDQIEISLGLVSKLKPKLLVVLNSTGAREIIKGQGFVTDNEFDYEIGTYNSTLKGKLPKTPVILASQLSGGAMGEFDKERLRWHMDWILGKIQNQ